MMLYYEKIFSNYVMNKKSFRERIIKFNYEKIFFSKVLFLIETDSIFIAGLLGSKT